VETTARVGKTVASTRRECARASPSPSSSSRANRQQLQLRRSLVGEPGTNLQVIVKSMMRARPCRRARRYAGARQPRKSARPVEGSGRSGITAIVGGRHRVQTRSAAAYATKSRIGRFSNCPPITVSTRTRESGTPRQGGPLCSPSATSGTCLQVSGNFSPAIVVRVRSGFADRATINPATAAATLIGER